MEETRKPIYLLNVRFRYKKTRGNSHSNIYRGSILDPIEIVSLHNTVEGLNSDWLLISRVRGQFGLSAKSVKDFEFIEILQSNVIGYQNKNAQGKE